MFSSREATISLIHCSGNIPNPRISFLALKTSKDEILIHGGNDEYKEYSDAALLDLSLYM